MKSTSAVIKIRVIDIANAFRKQTGAGTLYQRELSQKPLDIINGTSSAQRYAGYVAAKNIKSLDSVFRRVLAFSRLYSLKSTFKMVQFSMSYEQRKTNVSFL